MRNNYNTSSSGIDIEASIFLDGEMSSINFQENFVCIESGILKGKWMYVDFGNLFYTAKKYDIDLKNPEISELIEVEDTKYNRVIMTKFLVDEQYAEYSWIKENLTVQNMLEEFRGLVYDDDIIDCLDNLKISYKQKYFEGSTRGYSQGDYAEYVYLPDLLRECCRRVY